MRRALASAFLAGAVVAALAAVAVLYFTDREVVERGGEVSTEAPETVSVPNVLGQGTNNAVRELRATDLDPAIIPPNAAGDATVRTMNPDVGSEVAPGSTVTIEVEGSLPPWAE